MKSVNFTLKNIFVHLLRRNVHPVMRTIQVYLHQIETQNTLF